MNSEPLKDPLQFVEFRLMCKKKLHFKCMALMVWHWKESWKERAHHKESDQYLNTKRPQQCSSKCHLYLCRHYFCANIGRFSSITFSHFIADISHGSWQILLSGDGRMWYQFIGRELWLLLGSFLLLRGWEAAFLNYPFKILLLVFERNLFFKKCHPCAQLALQN